MEKIFKGERYLVTGLGGGENAQNVSQLPAVFKQAALKRGFLITCTEGWPAAGVSGISVGENVAFKEMQWVMDKVAQATRLSVFLSSAKDIMGKDIMSCPKEKVAETVLAEAILRSTPR